MDNQKKSGVRIADVRAAAANAPLAVYEHFGVAAKKGGQDRYVASCPLPSHGKDDSTPSFTIYAKDGKFHCYGCNANGDCIDFVREKTGDDLPSALKLCAGILGVGVTSLSPTPPSSKTAAAPPAPVGECHPFPNGLAMPKTAEGYRGYYYQNERGENILFKYAKDKSPCWYDGKKLQYRALPRRPIYDLAIVANASPSRPIILCEGEKAAQALADVDFLATTWPGGCQAWRKADWGGIPANRKIYLWPDDDKGGRAAAEGIAQLLSQDGRQVYMIATDGDSGDDAADIPESDRAAETARRMEGAKCLYTGRDVATGGGSDGEDTYGEWTGDMIEGRKKKDPRRLREALGVLGKAGRIRTDMATYTAYIDGQPISDHSLDHLARVLDNQFGVEVTLSAIKEAIGGVAERHTFNSFADELAAIEWDGVARLDSIATRYLGEVEDPDLANKYLATWLAAGVARRLVHDRPIKYDIMIVLRGEEGIGKNSFLDALFGDLIVSYDFVNSPEKDTLVSISGSMVVEMAELAGLAKRDFNFVKSFITRTADTFRAPYARLQTTRPRRQILCGTTNDDSYLNTAVGARRFADIHILSDEIDFVSVGRDRLQLFAEAYHRWNQQGMAALAIPKNIWAKTRDRNREIIQDSPVQSIVDKWIAAAAYDGYISKSMVAEKMQDGESTTTGRGRIPLNNIGWDMVKKAFEKKGWRARRVRLANGAREVRYQPDSTPTTPAATTDTF